VVVAFKKILIFVILGANSVFISIGSASIQDGLIGYWPYDSDLLDYSGLDNHGTAVGNPTFVAGKVGSGALDFHGSDYVRMNAVSNDITNNDITLTAWVKTTDSAGDWFSCNTSTGGNVALWAITGGKAAMYDSRYEGHSTTMVSDGNWHMLTYVRSGAIGYIYVDGVQENTHSANFNFSSNDRWSIAQEWDSGDPTDFLTGTIDDVAVWDRALTAGEIAYLYDDGKGRPPTKGPYVEITESGSDTVVEEDGATDNYNIALKSEPTAAVQITATPGDGEIDLGNGPGVPVTLDFPVGDWDTAQIVNVAAYDDKVYEGKIAHTTTITHTVVSGDEDYNGITISSVKVDVIDNELTCGDWGYLPSDLNRDCYVNLADFSVLAEQWLKTSSD
jgi:hypothetical protein